MNDASEARQYLELNGSYWYYRRRVPKDLTTLDSRKHIRRSTKQKDYARAVSVAERIKASPLKLKQPFAGMRLKEFEYEKLKTKQLIVG